MWFWLAACDPAADRPDDTGDTAACNADCPDSDTDPLAREQSVADAALRVIPPGSSAGGLALAFGKTTDGRQGAWVASYFASNLCRYDGLSGTVSPDDASVCLSAAASGEYLGYTMASNGSWVAAGAIGGSEAGPYAGKAYLWSEDLSGSQTTEAATAWVLAEAGGDYLGSAMAWAGELAGDGIDHLVIGAPSNDEGGAGAGKAYVFAETELSGEVLASAASTIVIGTSSVSAVKHGAPEAGDGVGSVVAGAGDVNGDGIDDLAVGCNGADDGATDAGLVSVFFGPIEAGVLQLRAGDAVITGNVGGQYVGDFVAALGDVTGDGYGDLGVSGEMSEAGRTWILAGPLSSATIDVAVTSFSGPEVGDQAGASLAGVGDADGDGLPDLVIGAYGNDTAATDAGAAFLVLSPFPAGAVSLTDADRIWYGEVEGDGAGRTVAFGGDYDGDGKADAILGAPYSDAGGPFSGAGYVVLGR